MNYYEELGLSPAAGAEEIKEAYRTLMRLLHPDLQRDPELQRAADLQVKKLNRIYAILSDPESRRRYDRDLAGNFERAAPIIIHAAPPPPRPRFLQRSSVAWVAAVTAFAVLMIWMVSRDVPVGPAYAPGAAAAGPAPVRIAIPKSAAPARNDSPASGEAEKLRANLARALNERDAALAEAEKLRAAPVSLKPDKPDFTKPEHAAAERIAKPLPPKKELTPLEDAPVVKLSAQSPALQLAHEQALALAHEPAQPRAHEPAQPLAHEPAQPRAHEPAQPLAHEPAQPLAHEPALTLAHEPAQPLAPAARIVQAPAMRPAQAPAPAAAEPGNQMSGTWYYRPPDSPSKNKELYPPEYIETSITEQNGLLRGTYRARYKVPDRPVAPEVNFQFAGAFTGDSGSLPWSGTGGSKGEVTITLMANHSLRIDWVADRLGALGFYRGTAVLVKRAD